MAAAEHGTADFAYAKSTFIAPYTAGLNGVNLSKSNSTAPVYTTGLNGVRLGTDALTTRLLWYSVAGFCLLVVMARLMQIGNAHLRHLFNLSTNPVQQAFWSRDRTTYWPRVKKHILYAPLHRKRHNREIQLSRAINMGTLPSRLHIILLLLYLISNIVYCCILDYNRHNKAALLAEVRGRTGHLSVINMVPLIILAGRNNPLIPLLRVSFDTYNLFHRWIGRIVVLEAVAHTLAWAVNMHAAKGYPGIKESLGGDSFIQFGLLATIAMVVILCQSPSAVRHAFYETFLHLHQLLAFAAILGVFVHSTKGHLPQQRYINWMVALWILERMARSIRIVYRNFSLRGCTKVTVEAMPGEACRVTFNLERPWRYTPGCHVYAYLPRVSLWMSHPFSVAWCEERSVPCSDADDDKLPSTVADLDTPISTRTATSISLVMCKRTGMTAKLYNKAKAAPTGIITLYGAVEGPYGGLESLRSYGTVILFAGGVGITHQISHVQDLIAGHLAGTVATRKVVLVWSVRTTETLEWVRPWMDEILAMPNRKEILKVLLFITKPRNAREVISRSEMVQMFPGRANPKVIVGKEMESRVGAMAVTVCGPGAFADDVRAAAREQVGRGTVDFVEESFTW
ncbi:hypothetical protein MMC29_005896 [Sticta canariensis]|nr:hypothetical protein [Sticta canariensis]